MEKGEEVERRRGEGGGGGGDNIKEWTGVDFSSSIRAAAGRGCCEVICGAPTICKVMG